jgi:AcrR family transcriptional regulator
MPTRRDELLEATVGYLLQNGVVDLSLRPLAAAIGTKARLLIYHFGSRDALVSAALSRVLGGVQQEFVGMLTAAPLGRALVAFWNLATGKSRAQHLRLIFEVNGLAMRNEAYRRYLRGSLESWRALVAQRLRPRNESLATLVVATVDGLLLDYAATGDRERTTRALTRFARSLK